MSFILRVHDENGIETNVVLGEKYKVVRKDTNEKDFNANFDEYHGEGYSLSEYDNTFAFISFNSGEELIALKHTDNVYVMTGSGQTFSNLTLKKNKL